jgi:ketosteroid isomerase-like protein
MQEHEEQQLVEAYIAAYNRFDVDGMLVVLHPDIRFTNYTDGVVTLETQGLAAFRVAAEQAKVAFASRRQTITEYRHEGDAVDVRVAYVGVLAHDLPNGWKAGEEIRLQGRSRFTFADGRIHTLADYA